LGEELTQVKAEMEKEQKLKEVAQSLAEKREDRLHKYRVSAR
jgi:arginine/lysine/ornithine decarboxylase